MNEFLLSASTRSQTRIVGGPGIALSEIQKISGDLLSVVDERVAALYPGLIAELKKRGPLELLPAGERSKNMENLAKLVNLLAERRFSRSDGVLAVGGGVTTDLGGFAASVYMRGIKSYYLTTTLLGMVDASIGGKCGVDLEAGKNLAGAFYQPSVVIADSEFLGTLPPRELANGIGEIIKYAVIADEELFGLLEDFDRNTEEIVSRCMRIKCRIVTDDEREEGGRMILNFGHTVGHAIEKLGGFERYSHGASVATGMIYESRFLERAGIVTGADTARIEKYVDKFGLRIPEPFPTEEIVSALASDKKRRGGVLHFAGYESMGRGRVFAFPMREAARLLREVL